MLYFAYVLKSQSSGRYYKGHCNNLDTRLKQHNSGKTKSIKTYVPWKVIYFEEFDTLEEAIKRERYFKTAAGRRYLSSKI